MRIHIEQLGQDSLAVPLSLDTGWAVASLEQAFEGQVAALQGVLELGVVGPGILVRGQARAVLLRSCDRCLAAVRNSLGGAVDLFFDPSRPEGDESVCLLPDELDVGFIDGEELDLAAVVAEFFLLESPSRLRCGDAGVARAEPGECTIAGLGDAPSEVDPRLAALKDFKPR